MIRPAKAVILLALAAMILPTVVREFGAMVGTSRAPGPAAGSLLGSMFAVLFWICFGIGIVVRLARFCEAHGPEDARWRLQRERRAQAAMRRPAEDVPADMEPEPPEDEDPDLPLED